MNKKKKKEGKNEKAKGFFTVKGILFLLVIVMGSAAILFSPVFSATNIVITKMDKYTDSEICEKIGLTTSSNIFLFGKRKAAKILEEDNYIESARLSIQLPNTIKVEIEERKVRGYVPYANSYLYIDEYGRVLDVQTSFVKKLPIVYGLEFDHFKEGQLLQVDNPESFDIVVKMAQMMTKYELLDTGMEIYVDDPSHIHAKMNHVEIELGDISDSDQKIRTLAEIIKTIPEKDRGVLDLTDLSKPIVFQYLT